MPKELRVAYVSSHFSCALGCEVSVSLYSVFMAIMAVIVSLGALLLIYLTTKLFMLKGMENVRPASEVR